jgi:sugar/nucleoside kinase (ribokinase family)
MKDVIGLGCLSVNLFFQIKNPEISDLKIEEFDKPGEMYRSSEDFQHYLDFVTRIGRKVWQHGGEEEANVVSILAKMGFDVGFVGKVGEDKFGEFLIDNDDPRSVVSCLLLVGSCRR